MKPPPWTPGPWPLIREELRGGVYWCVIIPGMEEGVDLRADENGEANARLISGATELAAFVEKVRVTIAPACTVHGDDYLNEGGGHDKIEALVGEAEALLAKIGAIP